MAGTSIVPPPCKIEHSATTPTDDATTGRDNAAVEEKTTDGGGTTVDEQMERGDSTPDAHGPTTPRVTATGGANALQVPRVFTGPVGR